MTFTLLPIFLLGVFTLLMLGAVRAAGKLDKRKDNS